jgi:phosphoenolpyruvate synthase/pyruvate phosphate dikinase
MVSILSFSDLGCLNESAAGSLGAGMASFVRAGFPTARGFVITPIVFSDYLKKPEIAAALDMHKSGAESPDDSWRSVKSVFGRTRIGWNHEMEILTAFGELGSVVSIVTTSRYGTAVSPVYGAGGEDVLDGIKHCWLKWLRSNMQKLEDHDMPAVLVKEVLDSEVSVELRKKGQEIRARAVFGLPD